MNYEDNYQKSLEEGLEFENYCYRWLEVHKGAKLIPCKGKIEQIQIGENKLGIEFKLDKKFRETGNLYIEIKERRHPGLNYTDSGIFRKDNSWLYAIGDYQSLYVFAKNRLVDCYRWAVKNANNEFRIVENQTKTSFGLLLPVSQVNARNLNATLWNLCPVTTEELNRSRGFYLPAVTASRKRTKQNGQLSLDIEENQQLAIF